MGQRAAEIFLKSHPSRITIYDTLFLFIDNLVFENFTVIIAMRPMVKIAIAYVTKTMIQLKHIVYCYF